MRRDDVIWIFLAALGILAWGSIPTWSGYQTETESLRFRGLHFDSQDYTVHLSMMQAGRRGEWAYQFRFTTEPHDPAHLRMFYLFLGNISRWINLAPEDTFELARWVLGFLSLLALYALMKVIFADTFWARAAFLLAALGSGLGWLQLTFNWTSTEITPIDFWLIDDYVFFSLSLFPHFAFVTLAMCIVLGLWLEYLETPVWRIPVIIGVVSVIVQFANPIAFAALDAGLAGAMFFAWWKSGSIRKKDAFALAAIAAAQIPLLAYNYEVLSNDPIWSRFTAQNRTPSPPFDYYLWGFGLFWLPALYGVYIGLREKSPATGASIVWIISGFVLAYAPVEIQRRFLQNVIIPLAILAVLGLKHYLEAESDRGSARMRWRGGIVFLFIFVASISSIQLSLGRALYLQNLPEELYYPASVDAAADWLNEHAEYNEFVLALEATSQVIAQKTGLRVYLGHEMETLDYETKRLNVQHFFEGSAPEIAQHPVQWVIYGPNEHALNPDFQPPANLELMFETGDLRIFKVK
jgi:hypothetical protein